MKRIMIAIAAVALTFGVSAQQGGHSNYVGLNLGGGLNTMTFSPERGNQSLGLGFDAGLHYAHFFNEHFGLGFGVHYTFANAYAKYNFNEVSSGLAHADNGNIHYDLTTGFNNWKESQTVGVLGIPIEAFYRTALNDKWTFIGGLGFQLDLPLHGSYGASEGSYSTTGTFSFFGDYVVHDLPNHGFSTYSGTFDSEIDNLSAGVSVIADAGMRHALNDKWGLYFGLYFGYGLTNMLGEEKDAPLLTINATDPSKLDYNGTFASNEIDAIHLLRLGVKVGVDFGWPSIIKTAEAPAPVLQTIDSAAAAKAEAERLAAEKARQERLAAERAAREKAAAEKAAREKAEAERLAAEKAAEKAAAERAAAKAEAERQLKAINATVYFGNSGTEAKPDEKTDAVIRAICEVMKADNNLKVVITGYTDNRGSVQTNMKYGQKRAEALRDYMVKQGVPAANIECVSKGPSEPIADNKTKEGRAKNRRATVKFK